MKYIIPIALTILLGCAHKVWVKDGANQTDFANDKQFCELYARAMNNNTTWSSGYTEGVKFKECMNERGWVSKNQDE